MKSINNKSFYLGLLFTLIITVISLLCAQLPLLNNVGALSIAILIAIAYRHFKGYPETYRSGITFSSKRLLKLAIILYGLKLNINDIIGNGSHLLIIDGGVIIFSIVFILLINRLIKGDRSLTLLLGIGTGICGAAAIAAVAPILKSKEEDTAISIGIIALIGTVFSLGYTLIYSLFSISPQIYGAWSGVSLHEIAHVILAADFSGETALKIGLLGKLGRVFLLVPVSIILIIIMKVKDKSTNHAQRIDTPYFLIGFILMAIINTYINIPKEIMNVVNFLTTICLLMAMVALGLNVSLKDLRHRAFKPLIAIIITSICLSVFTFLLVNIIY
ncbi:YeiH family protein [Staphylococcus gallinarum]|uniref:YeiH family protein n=1 Tax=Staphylococcus gallinarum TaxID=1293 RepID=UPI000D1C5E3A|nr:YeiH family protein [Staphylococcus gallinarum]MBU7218242.1 YeiH family protein [Staphylococcus gallinarum]PTE30038.1 putative sulfate exporter family transporter [Staphylococcus gallinarum]RIO84915.1 YeiH family putative sulfate export transporter [Staphylococcus gallinarum]